MAPQTVEGDFLPLSLISANHPVRATTKLYTPATSKDNARASSHCGLTQRDKLREKEEMGEYASSY